ncbi:MAG: FeoA family protein [bacterium]
MNKVSLTQMALGQSGEVVELLGGAGLIRRLEAMGIRIGYQIRKISSQFMRGPITVKVGQVSLALGYGMANKVMVKIDK